MKNNETPLFPNTVYHIYNHANGKENLFLSPNNYLFFLKRYAYFIEPIAETYAYCLLPNHLHLMVGIKGEQELQKANINFQLAKETEQKNTKEIQKDNFPIFLSKTFGNLFSSYSQAFNKQQKRMGSLFIPNFKRKIIESETYYKSLLFYIHNNPVHHGLVSKIEDWNYSSYHAYTNEKKTKVSKEKVLAWFSGIDMFKAFHAKEKIDISFDF